MEVYGGRYLISTIDCYVITNILRTYLIDVIGWLMLELEISFLSSARKWHFRALIRYLLLNNYPTLHCTRRYRNVLLSEMDNRCSSDRMFWSLMLFVLKSLCI